MTDVHVHLAALPTAENGCLLSRRMQRSLLCKAIVFSQKLSRHSPEAANQAYIERLKRELSRSQAVTRAVVLALDGVYDSSGRLDEARTDFLVANDYLFSVVAAEPRFLAGASVNPQRRDALAELERCAARGAVLIKVLPNVQGFDPAERRYLPFYKRMAELRLALLSHVGYEFSLFAAAQSFGEPERLIPALDQGVTVVAAHGCSTGKFVSGLYRAAFELARRYPNFFIDTSALTLPNRVRALFELRRSPELFDRLIFGTDYPLPCLSYPCLGNLDVRSYLRARALPSRFDRQKEVLEALGVPAGKDFMSLVNRSA
ncbi:MAG TPA: amidohydrolase family protein [Candidatus Acidoferrales bacterium]|nr:amidohydrolase family protein [Candidatus Acidoferrales bacterium]